MLKKIIPAFLLVASTCFSAAGQQLPYYTQYPSLLFVINPAYTGTKSNIDARMDYRKQWVGFDDAPVTKTVAVSSRFLHGRVGAGGVLFTDETGPTRRLTYGFSAAYHLHFPDVEVSGGFGVQFTTYSFDGTLVTIHNQQDHAIDRTIADKDKMTNANAGILLFNDRFHFGLGVLNMSNSQAEFYQNDTAKKAVVKYVQHYYFNVGYNFHFHPDYTWENNLMINYVNGAPMNIDYNLRMHYREKFLVGAAWRLKDALAPQIGIVFLNKFQFIYSYDLVISRLRKYNSGSHEVMLGYRQNFGRGKNDYRNYDIFQKQKFNLF